MGIGMIYVKKLMGVTFNFDTNKKGAVEIFFKKNSDKVKI